MPDNRANATSPDQQGWELPETRHYATVAARNALTNSGQTTAAGRLLAVTLALNTNSELHARITMQRLAHLSGLSMRSVRRSMRALEDAGEVVWLRGSPGHAYVWRVDVATDPRRWDAGQAEVWAERRTPGARRPERNPWRETEADTVLAEARPASESGRPANVADHDRPTSPADWPASPVAQANVAARLRDESLSEAPEAPPANLAGPDAGAERGGEGPAGAGDPDRLARDLRARIPAWGTSILGARIDGAVLHITTSCRVAADWIRREHEDAALAVCPGARHGTGPRRVIAAMEAT